MRYILFFCGLFLVANVVLFLWPVEQPEAEHVYVERDDVSPHFLRLNKEVDFKHRQSQQSELTVQVEETQPKDDVETCYRLGPFMHKANFEIAQAVLTSSEINFKASKRVSRDSLVYRVFLGPFSSQAEVDDVRVDLKRKKILDHFARKMEGDKYMVSLGIYSTQDAVDAAIVLFEEKLDDVQSQQEQLILPESNWLHFAIGEAELADKQLSSMDWGELAAKLGKFECYEG